MQSGYVSVSTDEQNLNLHLDALKGAGCKKIFKGKGVSGASTIRLASTEK